ncbi:MAG: helix-turn-helix protein [Firmicutes bacterium ADurb.Bin373]|nr:helix-turn-helix transcriptional regulator [Bacillota bacterium]OQA10741.1 MAG: helix-turn-helix protein [Firmicutes bacterium ADurb.Bin373]
MIVANTKLLKIERAKRGLSKTDLAKQLGVSHSVVVRAEQAKGTSPRTAKALSDFLELSFEELFTIVERPSGR